MKAWKIVAAAVLCGLGAAGCVTQKDTLKLDLPAEQKALVRGIAEIKMLIGVEHHASISAIDGTSTHRGWGQGYPVSVELLPGHHTLTVSYWITDQGSAGGAGEITSEIDARGGSIYDAELFQQGTEWRVRFREVTAEEIRANAERRARIRAGEQDI